MELMIGLIAGAIVGIIIGVVIGYIANGARDTRKSATLEADHRAEVAELKGRLEQVHTTEEIINSARELLSTEFQATASKVLQSSNEQFVQLANENLGKTLESAKSEFHQRHQQFQELVKPLSDSYGKLSPQIESLTQQNHTLVRETVKLSSALTDNQKAGNWGEIQLRRIVELASMTDYADFSEQQTYNGNRPDLIIKLPDDRAVVVDAKASLAAHLEASQAPDDAAANAAWLKHARALKAQVDNLSRKSYGEGIPGSLDFVVMFVPGDQFLASALNGDADLIEYAIHKRVAIATPASLIAMLWAIANGWERVRLAENAENIRQAGEEMHQRMLNFINHYQRVGKGLDDAVKSYNSSIGSFDSRVVPQGRKFAELAKGDADTFTTPPLLESEPRQSRHTLTPVDADAEAA